jgi:hypothetical protein
MVQKINWVFVVKEPLKHAHIDDPEATSMLDPIGTEHN